GLFLNSHRLSVSVERSFLSDTFVKSSQVSVFAEGLLVSAALVVTDTQPRANVNPNINFLIMRLP
ncbi:hypothetical protein R0K30_23510, partial [Bacillus sp. SIMBA_154]|uniref:hypothetical protein n=1 Tax=Bacillus sp. SIMBA_154 TaxID=3080859 RepID=UPI00397C117A